MDQLQKQLEGMFGFNATAAVKARDKARRGTSTGKRDSQRRKLYEADWSFHDAHPELRLGSFEEVEAFAKHVMDSERRKLYGAKRAISQKLAHECRILRNGRRRGAVHIYHLFLGSRIEFGAGSFHKATVLHELAHHYAPRAEKHGREFARVYVELVRRYLGDRYARELKERFRARGVKYTKPRKLSPQALEAARERGRALAEMNRAKREATQGNH